MNQKTNSISSQITTSKMDSNMIEYQVDEFGTQKWYQNDKCHRTDGPAIIFPDGEQRWYLNGQIHREDGPAIISEDGIQEWYKNGELHRTDGPAVIYPDGTQKWYLNDKLHREYQKSKIDFKELKFTIKDGL